MEQRDKYQSPSAFLIPEVMTRFQIGIVAVCVCIAGLDGFDVLVVAFTAPAIARDWAISPAALGVLFSAGLAGMGFGAILLAPLGDKLGRRPTVLLCLAILFFGMLVSAFSRGVIELGILRFFTGLGIGGVLASINIVVAEYASAPRRALCIALMSVGYPIGATIGGIAAVYLIQAWSWQAVYLFGAAVALLLVPAVLIQLPESLDFLLARRPAGALDRVNQVLGKLGRPALAELPPASTRLATEAQPMSDIFRGGHLRVTVTASALYLATMMTCYFLLSWTPKLLTDLGLSISTGISGSLLINIGGVVGCVLYGAYAARFGVRRLATFFMVGLALMTVVFGVMQPDVTLLMVAALAIGFCLHTSITVLYVVVPAVFPAAMRATGTGFAMSMGRVGAVIGPLLAGFLISIGYSRAVYCGIMALPVLVGMLCLYGLRALDTPAEPMMDEQVAPAG